MSFDQGMPTNDGLPRFSNLAVLVTGETAVRGLTFLAFVHLARVLEPEVYGLVELTLAVVMLCTLVIDLGFAVLGAREVARKPSLTENLVSKIVSAQVLLTAAVLSLLAMATWLLPLDATLSKLLLGYGISLLGLPFFLHWVFQGRDQMTWVALPQVVRQATFFILVLFLVVAPSDVLSLPVAEIVAVGICSLLFVGRYLQGGERLRVGFRAGIDREMFRETLPIGGSNLVWVLRMYLPIILIGILSDRRELGLFGPGHRIVMAFQSLMNMYFVNLFPAMSRAAYASSEKLRRLLHRSLLQLLVPTTALALSMLIAAPGLIRFVYGEAYAEREAILSLSILIWIIPIIGWKNHGGRALVTLHRQRDDLLCSLAGIIVLLALMVFWAPHYGAIRSALAMLLAEIVTAAITWLCLVVRLRSRSLDGGRH